MRSTFGCFLPFFPMETGFNLCLVVSSFFLIIFTRKSYFSNRFYFVVIILFVLVLLDSCATTFLVIWHILSIMLACFTSNQSRCIFNYSCYLKPLSSVLIERKKLLVQGFPNYFLMYF